MAAEAFIQCRVAPATKAALRAAAQRQQLTESALIKRVIETLVLAAAPVDSPTNMMTGRLARPARLYVRLTPGDRALLRERARARCLAPATYVSTLIHAHLRGLTPVPAEELQAIRRSTTALAAIGRNLNQIARASHTGDDGPGASREDLRALLKVCAALHDHVRSFIRKNAASWESGDAASSR